MPPSSWKSKALARALLEALEQHPKNIEGICDAFAELLKEQRLLSHAPAILDALTVMAQLRDGTKRMDIESAFPLSDVSVRLLKHSVPELAKATLHAESKKAPGIHLKTSTEHWDGRLTNIFAQLKTHLENALPL